MIALAIVTVLILATLGAALAGQKPLAAAGGVLAVVALAFSSFTHTASNEVSINHNFGTYQNTSGPGVTFVGPFTQSEKFTTRLQVKSVDNIGITLKSESEGVAGSPAEVDYTIRYAIDGTKHAEKMWRKFKTFERVTDELLIPESKTSAAQVLGFYVPADATAGKNRRALGTAMKADLEKALAGYGIKIDSVSVRSVALPKEVRERLAAVQKASATAQKNAVDAQSRLDTATKDKATAAQQAEADRLRRSTATRETIAQDCLRVVEETKVPLDCDLWNQNGGFPAR